MTNKDDADWSGFCPSLNSKKHIPHPPSKIVASVGIEAAGWKPSRRVHEKSANPSSSILSDVPPMNSSAVVGAGAWQTEARAASAQTKTSREQLTESGRSMFIRGKASTIPAYQLTRPNDGTMAEILRGENTYTISDKVCLYREQGTKSDDIKDGSIDGYSLVGYRSGVAGKSLLCGLGVEIAASLPSTSKGDEEQ